MAKTRMDSIPSSSGYSFSGEEKKPLLGGSGTGVQDGDVTGEEYEVKKTGAK